MQNENCFRAVFYYLKNLITMKKVTLFCLMTFSVGSLFFTSCEEDFQQEDFNLVKCDIPEGIIPLNFGSKAEAFQFLKTLQQRPPVKVYVNEEIEKIQKNSSNTPLLSMPLIKTRSEYGGGDRLDPSGWWFQSLSVNLFFDSIGGPVTITSYLVGFTFGIGWTQTSYSYSWVYSNGLPTIEYTVRGNEELYLFLEGIGQIFSNPIEVSGSYAVQ